MLAHALGNPFNVKKVKEICDKHNLWLIEDCCDALDCKNLMARMLVYGVTLLH